MKQESKAHIPSSQFLPGQSASFDPCTEQSEVGRCGQGIKQAWARVPEEFLWEMAQVLGPWQEPRQDQIQAVVLDPVQVPDQVSESAVEMTSSNDERETAWLSDAAPAKTDAGGFANRRPGSATRS